MRTLVAALASLGVVGCATPTPYIDPGTAGKAPGEVSRLVAASEAKLFPCSFEDVTGDRTLALGTLRTEVTLLPGRYELTLKCSSGYHTFRPKVSLTARPGKAYRVTGSLVDDSITVFSMRMRAKVEELPN